MSSIKLLSKPATQPDSESAATQPHVLLVVDQFPKALGGGERILLKLARLLPDYGYRVSILTFWAHPESAGLQSPPCPIYVLPLERTYDWIAVRGAFALRHFLREQNIQLVHTFFESSDIWAGFVTKALSRARLIWSRRDMGILRTRKHNISYRLLASAPDLVFAVSEQVRRHSIEVDGISADRVRTIYNGLNLAHWNPSSVRSKSGTEKVVATVGNIRRVKGHDVLLRAAASITQRIPGVTFRIAGDVLEPEYFRELQALIEQHHLAGKVDFVGPIVDLPEFLSTADLFVLPSRSEGFSNAIVEGMAASLPVVATDVGGNAEAVEHGVSGFIVPPDDPESLAAAITELLTNDSEANKMGAAGARLVREKFTQEAMMRQITDAYASLLGGRPAGQAARLSRQTSTV